jgi:ATP-dependent protease HslVU (ClpYQ) peptidase subunit
MKEDLMKQADEFKVVKSVVEKLREWREDGERKRLAEALEAEDDAKAAALH